MSIRWYADELSQLEYLVEDDWAWQFPGWEWVAKRLNSEFRNNRTANACRIRNKKYFESQKVR